MNRIKQLIYDAVNIEFNQETEIELTRPDEKFGDFSTNVAMRLAKVLGKNPREVAEILTAKLTENEEIIKDVSIAGPGFINFTLRDNELIEIANQDLEKEYIGQTIIAEYSDPNPFKPLHAGHLYTTLVGDVIARLVEMGGAKTIRINYGGDVGRHVAISMWSIIKSFDGEFPDKLAEIPETERSIWLGQKYVEGNIEFEENQQSKKEIIEINKRIYKIHENNDHDSNFAKIYWTCRDWSYEAFKELYAQLEVHPFDRFIPESEVVSLGVEMVNSQLNKGVYQKSEGAIIFNGDKYGLHDRVFINSEGLPTYETKEIGLLLTKWNDYSFDKSIIITANEIDQYMKVVLKSVEQYQPELSNKTVHITHGMVKFQGGVKMSSRKGNVITAQDIIESANKAGQNRETKADKETILAAIKYAFVKNRIGSDIIYDPEESIALEGNSGPYIQYAHARARSILVKSSKVKDAKLELLEADERSLLRKVGEYNEVVEKSIKELAPHLICTYLYELAQVFNRFYESNRVVGDNRENIRLILVEMYADRLKAGLQLLGITAPDRM
jgi:arginyl-tRNA synthetase